MISKPTTRGHGFESQPLLIQSGIFSVRYTRRACAASTLLALKTFMEGVS